MFYRCFADKQTSLCVNKNKQNGKHTNTCSARKNRQTHTHTHTHKEREEKDERESLTENKEWDILFSYHAMVLKILSVDCYYNFTKGLWVRGAHTPQ